MKKLILIVMAILLSFSFIGCANNLADEATEKGKLELENKDYDKALSLFELAIEEGSKDEEVKELTKTIKDYKNANKLIEEGNFEKAKKVLDRINKNYVNYSIKDDIDSLKADLITYEENGEYINNEISSIDQLIADNRYADAKGKADHLLANEKEISESQKQEIDKKIEIVNQELKRIETERVDKEKVENEKQELETKQKTEVEKESKVFNKQKAMDMYEKVFAGDIIWENYRQDLWSVVDDETYNNVLTLHFSNISGVGGSYAQFIREDEVTEITKYDGNSSFPDDPYVKYTVRNSDNVILNKQDL